ncbi:MAG: hypothetical protein ACE5IR_27860, partial [bacterium]
FLRSQHCDKLQGFHFSKPVPAERVRTMLRRARARRAGTESYRYREPIVVKDEDLAQVPEYLSR